MTGPYQDGDFNALHYKLMKELDQYQDTEHGSYTIRHWPTLGNIQGYHELMFKGRCLCIGTLLDILKGVRERISLP